MSTMSDTPHEDRYATDDIRAQAMLDALLGRSDPAQEAMSADRRKVKLDEVKASVLEATELVATARQGLESQGIQGEVLESMTQVFWHTLTHKLFS